MLSVASLLERWVEADQPWKSSTFVSYRSNAVFLSCDPLGAMRVVSLSPRLVRAALARWETAGATRSVLPGRFRVLRAAMGWAYREQIIDRHPIRDMRGPSRPDPRRPVDSDDLVGLLRSAEQLLIETLANDTGTKRAQHVATWPNRTCSCSDWPPTPALEGASWLPSTSTTFTGGSRRTRCDAS